THTTDLSLDDYTEHVTIEPPGPVKSSYERVQAIDDLREIDAKIHAPPPVRFKWGPIRFEAVVEKLSQKYTLFRPDGGPARATLSVTFKEYLPIERQLRQPRRESSDKTKRRQLDGADDIWLLVFRDYGDPRKWRLIADANDVDNPWRLGAGDWL